MSVELPSHEFKKVHDVLRLRSGAEIAILPNNGTILRCTLEGRRAVIQEQIHLPTESSKFVRLALAIPKPEKLEESVRLATEIGVSEIVIFPSRRTVVKWNAEKLENRLQRLNAIAREAAEVSFRSKLPVIHTAKNLNDLLQTFPEAVVMSESDKVVTRPKTDVKEITIVVGPEGGWDPSEVDLIGGRAVTLGPRVLRVDTAVAAACTLFLLTDF